jgi:hypothetical protein
MEHPAERSAGCGCRVRETVLKKRGMCRETVRAEKKAVWMIEAARYRHIRMKQESKF